MSCFAVIGGVRAGKTSFIRSLCSYGKCWETRNGLTLGKKELPQGWDEFVEFSPHPENPIFSGRTFGLFDALVSLVDVSTGWDSASLEAIRRSKTKKVLVFVNKADRILSKGRDSEKVLISAVSEISRHLLKEEGPETELWVGSLKHGICIFQGLPQDFLCPRKRRESSLSEHVLKVWSVLELSGASPKERKKLLWGQGYFEFVKSKKTLERDLLVHALRIPSVESLFREFGLFGVFQGLGRDGGRKQEKDGLFCEIVSLLGGTREGNIRVLLKGSAPNARIPSVFVAGEECRLSWAEPGPVNGYFHIAEVQITERASSFLLSRMEEETPNNPGISVIFESPEKFFGDPGDMLYFGVRVRHKEALQNSGYSETRSTRVELSSAGPHSLQAFLERSCTFKGSSGVIGPIYPIRRTPERLQSFCISGDSGRIRVSLSSILGEKAGEIKNISGSGYSGYSDPEEKVFLLGPAGSENMPGVDSAASRIRSALDAIKDSENSLAISHARIFIEPAGEESTGEETSGEEIRLSLERCAYSVVEKSLTSEVFLSLPVKYVEKSSDSLINKLISKKTVESLVKAISCAYRAKTLEFSKSPSLLGARMTFQVPASEYPGLLSVLGTFFEHFPPNILGSAYTPVVESPGKPPAEINLLPLGKYR
ncbi:uncharacterized protein NEMAJ01_0783 [Nematocida major]|uniref:uncharacterized protein n=1 Tax=Nematocida major TaxID=1912982 RepID=UPI0020081C75|nr:uncharacterized protein NEMAJ01_0783 [Nematocida major]KAH9385887.1 hypothetical protein NEMAJ01_0783 [Nematocida major]